MIIVPGSAFFPKMDLGDGCSDPLTDSYWGNVELLCWCNGVDDGTTFTDETGNYTITNNSSLVTTQTGNKKFGTAAAETPVNVNQELTAGLAADWKFLHDGTTDFTAEMWLHSDGNRVLLFGTCAGATDTNGVFFHVIDGGGLGLHIYKGSDPAAIVLNIPWTSIDIRYAWHHIVFQRDTNEANKYQIFVDGVLEASSAGAGTEPSVDPQYELHIGGMVGTNYYAACYIDDIRITKGIARYPASGFTPPCRQLPNS